MKNSLLYGATFFLGFVGFIAATPARSAATEHSVAVLEFNGDNSAGVSAEDKQQLAETLRGIARRNLPKGANWTVLTGENTQAQISAGSDLSNCNDQACILSAGHKLQVDYIVAGSIGRIGPYLQASFSLYNVASGQLMGSEWPRGKTVDDIIDSLNSSSDPLFASLGQSSANYASPAADNSRSVVVESYPAVRHVVVYRRPVYYANPVVFFWVPIFFLIVIGSAFSYHHSYR